MPIRLTFPLINSLIDEGGEAAECMEFFPVFALGHNGTFTSLNNES